LWTSWFVLLVVLVVLDGFIDLVLSCIKQHHDLLSSQCAESPTVEGVQLNVDSLNVRSGTEKSVCSVTSTTSTRLSAK
jgi:hypothetical protein